LGVSFFLPLLLFKASRNIIGQLSTPQQSFSATAVVKSLFAQASGDIQVQDAIDEEVLDSSLASLTLNDNSSQNATSCLSVGNIYSAEELAEEVQEIKGGGLSEDVGRYIGYGRKEFTSKGNALYGFLKLFFPVGDKQ